MRAQPSSEPRARRPGMLGPHDSHQTIALPLQTFAARRSSPFGPAAPNPLVLPLTLSLSLWAREPVTWVCSGPASGARVSAQPSWTPPHGHGFRIRRGLSSNCAARVWESSACQATILRPPPLFSCTRTNTPCWPRTGSSAATADAKSARILANVR